MVSSQDSLRVPDEDPLLDRSHRHGEKGTGQRRRNQAANTWGQEPGAGVGCSGLKRPETVSMLSEELKMWEPWCGFERQRKAADTGLRATEARLVEEWDCCSSTFLSCDQVQILARLMKVSQPSLWLSLLSPFTPPPSHYPCSCPSACPLPLPPCHFPLTSGPLHMWSHCQALCLELGTASLGVRETANLRFLHPPFQHLHHLCHQFPSL